MLLVLDILSWICIVLGSGFLIIGGIGLLRLPDFYTRTHAAGLTDTMGMGLVIIGLLFQAAELVINGAEVWMAAAEGSPEAGVDTVLGPASVAIKLGLVLLFLFLTSPTSGHTLAKAAWGRDLKPLGVEEEEVTSSKSSSSTAS